MRYTLVAIITLLGICHSSANSYIEFLLNAYHKVYQKYHQQTASILFAGDISLAPPIRKKNTSACEYSGILKFVKGYFKEADYNVVNLESPFVFRSFAKKKFHPGKGVLLRAWPESVEALTSGNIKAVTIANNHIADYGKFSAALTEEILRNYSIDVVGLARGLAPSVYPQVPIIKELNGITFGILGYCGVDECEYFAKKDAIGPALLQKQTVENDIKVLKSVVDIIIVYLHWGKEYFSIPLENQRRVAEFLSDLGVHLIIGAHPHVLQGHEWINNTLIHYSLGNFVFHPHFTYIGLTKYLDHKEKVFLHKYSLLQHRMGRGPAALTELFKVVFTKNGIKEAFYLPTRIHVDWDNGCLYPKPKTDKWLRVCGKDDDNCYQTRRGDPIFP